jgi:hypothetical protein
MAKKLLTTQYAFSAANKSITLNGNIAKERLLLITNVNTGDIIYNFGDPDAGATSVVYLPSIEKTQISLKFDTTAMDDADNLQIFIEKEEVEIIPGQTYLDPVSKLRVSTPENLIDTDFEYGLQATRWETAKLVNNIPTFYTKNANAPLTVISVTIAANSKQVTVVTDPVHELIPGAPFEISGLSLNRFEGSFLVKSTSSANAFTYEAALAATPSQAATPNIATAFTAINPGAFYTGSNISVNKIDTNGANPSVLTVTTPFPHGFKLNNEFYFLNTVSFSKTNFNAATAVDFTDTISTTKTIQSSVNGSDTTNYLAKTVVLTNWISTNTRYFQSSNVIFNSLPTTLSVAAVSGNIITVNSKVGVRVGQRVTSTDSDIGPDGKNIVTSVSTTNNQITLKYPVQGNGLASNTSVTFIDDAITSTHGLTSDTLNFAHLLAQESNTVPAGLTDNTSYIVHALGTNTLRFYLETATGRKTISGNYKEIAAASGTTTNTLNLSSDATLGNSFNLTGNSFAANDAVVYDVAPFSFTTSNASINITGGITSQVGLTNQETIQINAHAFVTGQKVLYTATTAAIGGLTTNSIYYLQNAGVNNVRLFNDYTLITTSNTPTANGYVNPTTEIIRWDNHGFQNGDVVAYNVLKSAVTPGGDSSVVIGGLTGNTNLLYWVQVIDVNTFSLHTANTLTIANRVNLTSSGTTGQAVHLFLRGLVDLTSAGTITANAHQFRPSASLQLNPREIYWIRDVSTVGQARFRLTATPAGTAIPLHFTGKSGFAHRFTRGMDTTTSVLMLQNHGFLQDEVVILDTSTTTQTIYPGGRAIYGRPYFVQYVDANKIQLRNSLLTSTPITFGSYGFAPTTDPLTNGFTLTKATQVDLSGAGTTVYGPNHILFGLNRIQVAKGDVGNPTFLDDTIHTYNNNGIANNDTLVLLGSGTQPVGLAKSSNNYNDSNYTIYTANSSSGSNNFKLNAVTFTGDAGGYAQPLYVCETSQPTLADSIYSVAHGFINNTYVQYTNTGVGASVIGGLTNNAYYYVVDSTANNFKLSATNGGAAINLNAFGAQNHNFILTANSPTRDTIVLPTNFSTGTRLVYSPAGQTTIGRQLAGSLSTGNLASTFYTLINQGSAIGGTRYRITQNSDTYNLSNISFTAFASTFTATFIASTASENPTNLEIYDSVNITGSSTAWFNDVFAVASVVAGSPVGGLATATVTLTVPAFKDKSLTLSSASATAKEFINLTSVGVGTQSFNTESGVDGVYKINASSTDSATTFTVSSPVEIDSTSKSFASTDVNTTADTITLADHRYTDGTVVVYTQGTSAIGGLSNSTSYYVIVINKDTIRLSLTAENAQGTNTGLGLGKRTKIDLTTQGTGTHTLTSDSIYGERPSNDSSVNAGTATLLSGSLFVTGVSSKFLTLFSPGEKFRVYSNSKLYEYEIDSVKSDTRIKLKSNIPLNYGAQGDEGNSVPSTEVTFASAPFAIQTKVYPKSDAVAVHRPFDGGVDMVAGAQPRTRIVRQTKKYFRYQSGKGIQISLATNFNPPFDVDSITWDIPTSTALVNTKRPHNFSTTNFSNIIVRLSDAEVASGFNPYNGTFNVNSIVDDFQFRYKPAGYSFTGNLTLNSNVIENIGLATFNEIQIGGLLSSAQLPSQTLGNGDVAGVIVNDVDVISGKIYLASQTNRSITGIVSNLIGMSATPTNPFANGNIVQFNRTANNIIKDVPYYVVNSTTAGFNISNTLGGSAITLVNINTTNSEAVTSIAADVVNVSGTNDYLNNDLIQFNNTVSNIVSGKQYLVRDRTTSSFKLSDGKIETYARTSGSTIIGSANQVYSGVSGQISQATVNGASWTSNVATLNYSGSYIFPISSIINVQGMTPAGYNGVYVVTGNSTNTVSYALTTNPGAFSIGGIVSNPSIGSGAKFTIARDNAGAIPTAVTKNGSLGADGENTLVVTSNTGIIVGAGVTGTNIPANTKVTEINGTTITISNPLVGIVTGSVTFDPVSIDDAGQYYAVGDVITIRAEDIGNLGGVDVAITVGTINTTQLANLAGGSVPVGFTATPIPIIVSPKFSANATVNDASISVSKTPTSLSATGFPKFNITKYTDAGIRCGMFDAQNGFFFEFDGSTINCVRRSSTQQIAGLAKATKKSRQLVGTETKFNSQLSAGDNIVIRGQTYRVIYIENDTSLYFQPEYKGETLSNITVTKTVDTKVTQSQWNIDPCDGTGKHGYLLDLSRIQMCYADYSWYGAGKIRFGFKDQEGEVKYVHEFIHNNKFTEAYFRSGNIPVRYEAYTENAPDFSPAIFHWGTSVIMDGRFDDDKAYLFTGDSKFLTFTNGSQNSITAANIVNTGTLPAGVTRVIEVAAAQASNVINGAPISGTGLTPGSVIVSSYRSSANVRIITSPQPISTQTNQTYTIGDVSTLLYNLVNITSGNGIPLISVRLAPSVDNGLTGPVGYRDIINRMQMNMASAGIISTHDLECKLVLNGILSNDDFTSLKPPSLAQLYKHSVGDTVTGGDVVFAFRATGGDYTLKKGAATNVDLVDLTTLGNSILGGDGVFPNGPDVLTLTINPVEPSLISGAAPLNVSARISWKESQA